MPIPSEEIINPQITPLLEGIDSRLPAEEVGVLTESGRINKQGREIADNVYQEFLSRSNGDFKQVLELCRETESILDVNDPDSRDNETVKIIQSVRGKVVYNAHRTWVEKQMNFDAYGMGDLSASNVMKYAHILKADQKVDVYEETTNIERERAEVNEQLGFANERLQQENDAIVEADIESVTQELPPTEIKSILNEIKTKLGNFTKKTLEPNTRRKIVAGALSTLAVAGIALGYVANLRNSKPTSEAVLQALSKSQTFHIERQSIEELENAVVAEESTVIEEDYLTSNEEIPEVVADLSTGISEMPSSDLDSNVTEQSSTVVDVSRENDHRDEQELPNENSLQIPVDSLRIVDSQHPIDEVTLNQEILPRLVKIKDVSSDIWVLNENTMVLDTCINDLEAMFQEARSIGISMYVRSAFRSIKDQEIAYNQATDKTVVTLPGTSQHHTGLAIDFTSPEIGNVVDINAKFGNTKAGKWLTENAWKYGFVLSYTHGHDNISNEDWHYFYVGHDLAKIWHDNRLAGNEIDLFALQLEYGSSPDKLAFAQP